MLPSYHPSHCYLLITPANVTWLSPPSQAYVPALRTQLLKPLLERGSDAIPEVIAMLDEYQLTKDDFDAIMELELLTGAGAPVN